MSTALTIALPVHNLEASLSENVTRMLEVASELATSVRVIVIDDGSTDDTYEVARELSLRYPQVASVRLSQSAGLPDVISAAKRHALPGLLCVHDGSSEIRAEDLVTIWQRCRPADGRRAVLSERHTREFASRRFAFVSESHGDIERAHQRLRGFRVEKVDRSRDENSGGDALPTDSGSRRGATAVPPLATGGGFVGEVVTG